MSAKDPNHSTMSRSLPVVPMFAWDLSPHLVGRKVVFCALSIDIYHDLSFRVRVALELQLYCEAVELSERPKETMEEMFEQ